jgi:hypothetical protein
MKTCPPPPRSKLSAPAVVTPILVGLLLTLASGTASATPEFPGVVEQTLGLTSITVDPPQGCTLCHTTDSGGTALRTFGALVQQYGAQPYQDDTLKGALAAIEEREPQFIADIKAGRDPNDDQTASSIPTPSYGCAASPLRPRGADGWILALAALAALARIRVRRRPVSRRPGSTPTFSPSESIRSER